MVKLGLAIIVGTETDVLRKMLESVKPVSFDCISAVMTKDSPDTEKVLKEYGCKITRLSEYWKDDAEFSNWDFAAARNLSFDNCDADYIMYLDSDDVLINSEKLRGLISDVDCLELPYNYRQGKNDFEEATYSKERVVKKGSYRWRDLVHEVIIPQKEVSSAKSFEVVVKHDYAKNTTEGGRSKRNFILTKRQYELTPDDSGMIGTMAREYELNGFIDEAISLYKKHLTLDIPDIFKYQTQMLLCNIFIDQKKPTEVLRYARYGTKLIPESAEAFFKMAWAFYELGHYDKALEYCKIGFFEKKELMTYIAFEAKWCSYLPTVIFDNAACKLGKWIEAAQVLDNALIHFPNDPYLSYRRRIVNANLLTSGVLNGIPD